MKIVSLTKEQFDRYASKHFYNNYFQTSMYGELMSKYEFSSNYIGFIDENKKLVAASLILYKEIFMNYKYAYAPRGFLIDYSSKELLKDFIDQFKKLLYKQNFIFLKIDPQIFLTERDREGNIIAHNPKANQIVKNLEELGFKYRGQTKYFETVKPRWEAIVKLQDNIETIYTNLSKNVRNKINKAIRSGIEIYRNQSGDVEGVFNFIKKKHARPLEYYKDFYEIYNKQNMFEIYYARLNTEKYVINSKNSYENELEINDDLAAQIQNPASKGKDIRKLINKKMESDKLLNNYKNSLVEATNLLKQYPEGFNIGGAFVIKYGNTAYLLIEGFDERFRDLNCNYLLKWVLIQNSKEEEYKLVNLNGVIGEFKEDKGKYAGLNEMKLGFNSTVAEYIGEFDFVINPLIYNMYANIKPVNNSVKKENN